MNWPKVKTVNLQPLVDWLVRQRTEVVLLLIQCSLGVYVVMSMIPDALNRQERIANQIEIHHTTQLREQGKQFQSEQLRDAKERELLIQKLIGGQAADTDPAQVAHAP